jgi:hypothetical protein
VERPSRMNKAALADAVARKETERLVGEVVWATAQREVQSAAEQVQNAARTTVQQEVQSAMQLVQGAVRSAAQPAARLVRETVREVVRQEAESAAQDVRRAMRAAVEQELQAAEGRVRQAVRAAAEQEIQAAGRQGQEAGPAAAEDSAQTPVQAGRTARGRASSRFQKGLQHLGAGLRWVGARLRSILPTVLTAVITAAAIAIFASDYYTSRIADWAFRRGTPPVSTEVALERESRVQGLTWVLRKDLGLDDLGAHAQLILGQAAASPGQFNDWVRGQGGVDVDFSFLKLTVTGNRQAGVTITGLQAKVEKREPPFRGALFYHPPEGERENAQIGFDLDEAVSVARIVEPNKNLGDRGYLGSEYFMNKSVDLALGEQQVFNVVAMTTGYYYAWHLEVEVKAGGRTKYITVDLRRDEKDPPSPFKLSARADPRKNKKGNFAVYKELYVLDRSTDRAGFISGDPNTYTP